MQLLKRPKFTGPKKDWAAERWARLELASKRREMLALAIRELACGRLSTSAVLDPLGISSASLARARIQERKRKRADNVLLLASIEGIGVMLADDLIAEFGTLEAVAEATPEQLQDVSDVGEMRAEAISKEVPKLIEQSRSR